MRLRALTTKREARDADEEQKPARRFRGSRPARGRERTVGVSSGELRAANLLNRTTDGISIRSNGNCRISVQWIGRELEALRLKGLELTVDRGRADELAVLGGRRIDSERIVRLAKCPAFLPLRGNT